MKKREKYWWGIKYTLRTYILWYVPFAIGTAIVLYIVGIAGGGDVVKGLVLLPISGAFLLKIVREVRAEWPPTEERVRRAKERKSFGGGSGGGRRGRGSTGGAGPAGYTCENCGTTLYGDRDISTASGTYTCHNCDHPLDDQSGAGVIYAYGEDEWDEEDGGSNPAPWDEDYGDPAPWDDDYVDSAPWDDDYVETSWDDDDSW